MKFHIYEEFFEKILIILLSKFLLFFLAQYADYLISFNKM